MSHQQSLRRAEEVWADDDPSGPFLSLRQKAALVDLRKLFDEVQALAVLIGDGTRSASCLIEGFAATMDDDVTIARIAEPCSTAIDGMRAIIEDIGFDAKDLKLTELEQVFRLFLDFQKKRRLRTVLSVENAHNHGSWMLDLSRRLVELETENQFGLMVVLSGGPDLSAMLGESPLDTLEIHPGQRLAVDSFTLAETREYVRRRIEAAGHLDIARVFEFDAITRIHELSKGVRDSIDDLCRSALETSNVAASAPITAHDVSQADEARQEKPTFLFTVTGPETQQSDVVPREGQRFIVRVHDKVLAEQPLDHRRTLIGRAAQCDICLGGRHISRHHALIFKSWTGVEILDLSSTNGTFVNGVRTRERELHDGDIIGFGDIVATTEYTIEFVSGDQQRGETEHRQSAGHHVISANLVSSDSEPEPAYERQAPIAAPAMRPSDRYNDASPASARSNETRITEHSSKVARIP